MVCCQLRRPHGEVDTIANIKGKIHAEEGTPEEQMRLVFNQQELNDDATVAQCNIVNARIIHLVLPLVGDKAIGQA